MSAPTPSAVGNKFVVSYYTQLNQNPNSLRHFYKENAVLTHGSESSFGANEETVTGVEEINKKIQKLDFRDCHVTLSVVDCQASQNGVLVLVVGHLSNKAEPPRKFVQSFFLAEQNKAYFVLNDVFRFVEEPKAQDQPVPAQEPPKEEPAQQPVTQEQPQQAQQQQPEPVESKKEKPSVPAPSAPVAAAPVESQASSPKEQAAEPVKAAAAPPAKQASPAPSQAKRDPKASAPPAKKVTAAPPPPQEEKPAGPKSWSNIVGGPSAVTQSPPPVEAAAQPAQAQKKSTPQQPQKQPRKEKVEEKAGTASLFVNNVPFSVTDTQMRAVFNQFGEIKAVTIVSHKGFVFLEYASVEQAQKAIDGGKNGQLSIDGRVLTVEESKKDKKQGGSKGSRPPREKGDRVESKGEKRDKGERASNGKQSAAKQ